MKGALARTETVKLMGNRFEFTAVSDKQDLAVQAIAEAIAEVRRIEELLSTFKEQSQVSEINRLAGIRPAKVDDEVVGLILRSLKISAITQGAFDIPPNINAIISQTALFRQKPSPENGTSYR